MTIIDPIPISIRIGSSHAGGISSAKFTGTDNWAIEAESEQRRLEQLLKLDEARITSLGKLKQDQRQCKAFVD